MGKKGGKKGKIDKAVENAEPNLPTIPEEDSLDKSGTEVKTEDADELSVPRKSRSIKLKSKSNVGLETHKSSKGILTKAESSNINLDASRNKSQVLFEAGSKVQVKSQPNLIDSSLDVTVEGDETTRTERKGKKAKHEPTEEQEQKPKKKKQSKKEKAEGQVEDEEKSPKKDKKGKKLKKEKDEELEEIGQGKEKKTKEKKGKKGVQLVEDEEQKRLSKERGSERFSRQMSGTAGDFARGSRQLAEQTKSTESLSKKKKRMSTKEQVQEAGSKGPESYESMDDKKGPSRGSVRPSIRYSLYRTSTAGSDTQKRKSSSRMSAVSSESSTETTEYRDEQSADRKEKKGKRKKGEKAGQKKKSEMDEETEEEKEIKRAEKEAEKIAKKQAKIAAREEAKAKKKAEKVEKLEKLDADDVKKKLDQLKKMAKEMGIAEEKMTVTDGDEQGPKKKISKKEKAKLTAESAEKAKAEQEAQVKRMEELIKKKQEEERRAAIEKDKKETLEQGLRIEQLQETFMLIKDIVNTNTAITKDEKELLEWKKYVECGKLPNPAMCDQMNTYLHLWELDLENTSIDEASNRTTDAVKLLNDLDELVDTVSLEDAHRLENWKWIRQLFREFQAASLDVATYRLLRDVEHNLNRINIPTANFNFKDDYVTLCLWLRVMLPTPLPNPRRPPKPRVDINFEQMDVSVLFPLTIDCENAAIRAMYLKYDHLSDLSEMFTMPDVPREYYMDLITINQAEWRAILKYKYDNRDKQVKSVQVHEAQMETDTDAPKENPEEKGNELEKRDEDKKIKFEETEEFDSDEEIPLVPFKQLNPCPSEHVIFLEDKLYNETRINLRVEVPENVINLRKFVILGGLFHLNLLAQPPQPQDFITMDMTITGLYLPKKLEVLPFKVVYTPYVPPEPPPPTESTTSVRKLPEELEEEIKKQEEELDKLIAINIKWPQHVIFLELPIVCRWDDEKEQWSNEEIHDVKHNEDKCMLSFRTGVFGIYGLASYRFSNLPFQAYDIKPEIDDSVTVQLTAAILMLEFNIKDGLIAITQLQNSPNMTLQDAVGRYIKLHQLKRMMKEAGIDIFPAFDAFCYVEGCCEKQWAMEQHLYYNMAQISNCFNFAWSRWNLQAGRRKIVLQMRQYEPDKGKQKNHQMLLVTPLKATFIECTEVSQAFSEKEIESLKFCADLYHLMKITSGIFVRNKVSKASKQNVNTLAQFLISIRILSFS